MEAQQLQAIASSINWEKIIIAVVIVTCIILFSVGLSRLFKGDWQNGLVVFLLGVGGIAGSVYWIRNPIKTGGSFETVVDVDGADEYVVEVDGGCDGGHEADMLAQLQEISSKLGEDLDEESAAKIREMLEEANAHSAGDFAAIEDLLNVIKEKTGDCKTPQVLKPLLEKLKELACTAGEKSIEVCKKIEDICNTLDNCEAKTEMA